MSRAASSPDRKTFGRRLDAVSSRGESILTPRPVAPAPENFRFRSELQDAMAAHEVALSQAKRLVVHFNWWMTWVAFGILVVGISTLAGLLNGNDGTGLHVVKAFHWEDKLFIASAALMIVIGAVWFAKGLFGREALVMTDDHVRGFTLFGTKTIRWEDISRVKETKHETYGTELQIHATRGTPSSSLFLNCIPLYVGLTERTCEEILEAIRVFRPDL